MRVPEITFLASALAAFGCAGDDGGGGDADTTSVSTSITAPTTMPATSETADTSGSPTSMTSTADATGDTGSGSSSSDGGSSSGSSTGAQQTIPDPGAGMDSWIANGDVSTPGTAWPVGIATVSPGYIEADAPAGNGNAFWVFEAGPALSEFVVSAVAFTNPIEHIHLHDGSGGVFGGELVATVNEPCCGGGGLTGTWDVTPGNVYVFEVHVPGGATV